MTITGRQQGTSLTLALSGRLDTNTAPELERALPEAGAFSSLTLDFAELGYVSSAGLRVLLAAQKRMEDGDGGMRIINVREDVMEVFEMTGFTDTLTIDR